jgi:hypothetical protein
VRLSQGPAANLAGGGPHLTVGPRADGVPWRARCPVEAGGAPGNVGPGRRGRRQKLRTLEVVPSATDCSPGRAEKLEDNPDDQEDESDRPKDRDGQDESDE